MEERILDVLIVGGGLSGLFVGHGLQQKCGSIDWKLLEASPRLGGRLCNDPDHDMIDMGGAWIWPKHQPHMRQLVRLLGLSTFVQPGDDSSTRIDGGAVQLIEGLRKRVESDPSGRERIHCHSPVVSCKLIVKNNNDNHDNQNAFVEVVTASKVVYRARHVVFAIPPRLLSVSITFEPPLSSRKQVAMSKSRTWMAGVTKVALVYPQRFWDSDSSNMGLLGAMGPAFQVYDSSTKDNNVSGLTFFTHVPPESPSQTDDALLAKEVANQMALFWNHSLGRPDYARQASSYTRFHVYRWPTNPFTSDAKDRYPSRIHPHPLPDGDLATPEWIDRLLLAGTETDQTSPGVMEGAIGAAERVLDFLLSENSTSTQPSNV